MYLKAIAIIMTVSFLLGTTSMTVGATNDDLSEVLTEIEDGRTKMTYALTAGKLGNSTAYSDRNQFKESDKDDAFNISAGKGGAVLYTFPLYATVRSVLLTVDVEKGYGIEVSCDNENWTSVVDDCYVNARNRNLEVPIPEEFALSGKYFYIRFEFAGCINEAGTEINKWHDGFLYGMTLTVLYEESFSIEEETDDYGATVKTFKKGTDYMEMMYSMTAGTAGTSGGYCVSIGSAGKARENAYCGGKGSGGVIFKFPILFSDHVESVSLLASVAYKYGIDISLDNVNWTEVEPDNDNQGQKNVSLNLSAVVKSALAEQSSDNLYIRFYHDSDWNAPMVYSLSVSVGYSCQGSVKTVFDEHGAGVMTITTRDYSKVVTSFTAVTGDVNYYVEEYNGEKIGFDEPVRNQNNQYVTDWGRMVIYGYPIDNPTCLEEFWWEAVISQQVCLEVTTDKKISAASDLGLYKDGAEAIWSTVYRYVSETDGVEDKGLPATRFSVNLAEYVDIDDSVSMVYVRVSDAYPGNGSGGKFGGSVIATAWYDYGTAGELSVKEGAVKEILYGQGRIDPDEWLVCRYTVARTGEVKEREVDSSLVDIEWTDAESGKSLGMRTPTAPGKYKVSVTPNSDWNLRFEVDPLAVEGFVINCDHSQTGYDCDEQDHWLKCDGCGALVDGSREAHSRDGGEWQWNETKHWFCCKCGSYDFEYGEHRLGEWQHDMLKHWQICEECGYTVESTLHDWDSGVITTKPTVDATGVKTFTCKTCGYKKTQKVDKLTEPDTVETKPSNPSDSTGTEEPETPDTGCGCASSFTASACVVGFVSAAGILLIRRKYRRDADR